MIFFICFCKIYTLCVTSLKIDPKIMSYFQLVFVDDETEWALISSTTQSVSGSNLDEVMDTYIFTRVTCVLI